MENTTLILLSRLELLCCDQATVAMRPYAGLAGVELALLARRGTTCGTSDSEYLLRSEFFFHSREIILQASGRVCTLAHLSRVQAKAIFRSGRERGRANQIGVIDDDRTLRHVALLRTLLRARLFWCQPCA
jgi:hypothetical protein